MSTTHRRSLWAKMRNASVAKVPNVLVVGEREQTERTVTLQHGSRDQHTMTLMTSKHDLWMPSSSVSCLFFRRVHSNRQPQ